MRCLFVCVCVRAPCITYTVGFETCIDTNIVGALWVPWLKVRVRQVVVMVEVRISLQEINVSQL